MSRVAESLKESPITRARLVPFGAVRVRLLYDGSDSCIVMQDIEGNEFCLD